jgi:hypothetical protein
MEVHHHNVDLDHPYGGITISLDGNEVAHAVDLYISSLGIVVAGPRTVRITDSAEPGHTPGADVFVDPSGRVIVQGDLIPVGCSATVDIEVVHHRETFSVEKSAAPRGLTQEQIIAVLSGEPPHHLDGYAWLASGCPSVMNLIVFDGDLNVTHEEWQKITSAGCRLWIKGTTSVGMTPGQAIVL